MWLSVLYAAALVGAAATLALVPGWRRALLALWAVQGLVAFALYRLTTIEIAVAKLITGTTVCLILLPTLRILFKGSVRARRSSRFGTGAVTQRSTDEFFRLATVLLAAGAAVALAGAHPLVEEIDNFSWAWLALLGLTMVLMARDVVRVGLGLLLILTSVDLLATLVGADQGIAPVAARNALLVALAIVLCRSWTFLQLRGAGLRHAESLE